MYTKINFLTAFLIDQYYFILPGHVTRDFPSWHGPLNNLISSSIPPCIRAMISFTQHRLCGGSWYSPPFYTGPGGYKLQLRVDPNTSTKPKGIPLFLRKNEETHISVCVHLIKGENDDCLGWPFKGSVTVKLLNWIEDENHLEHSFSTTSVTDPQSFSRVTHGVRAPGEMYQRHFIAHNELEFNGEKKTHYVMKDVLCFAISSVEVLSSKYIIILSNVYYLIMYNELIHSYMNSNN